MKKTLSIVIPVYNEEKRLSITFAELLSSEKDSLFCGGFNLKEIIFVNDGSSDSTLRILKSHKTLLEKSTKAKVRIVSYSENHGKGYAVKRGMLASTSDYILFMDADISTPIKEITKLEKFVDQGIDVVIGTRKNSHSTVKIAQPIYRQVFGRIFTHLSQLILNTWVTDFTCGFKLFSAQAAKEIFSRAVINGWGYDSEIIFLARTLGFSIAERAVEWSNKEGSRVHIAHDAAVSFSELVKIRFFDLSGKYAKRTITVNYA